MLLDENALAVDGIFIKGVFLSFYNVILHKIANM